MVSDPLEFATYEELKARIKELEAEVEQQKTRVAVERNARVAQARRFQEVCPHQTHEQYNDHTRAAFVDRCGDCGMILGEVTYQQLAARGRL